MGFGYWWKDAEVCKPSVFTPKIRGCSLGFCDL